MYAGWCNLEFLRKSGYKPKIMQAVKQSGPEHRRAYTGAENICNNICHA